VTEDQLQASIVDYVRWVLPHAVIFAVPNGGLRTKREAAKLKWTGALAGVSDLVLLACTNGISRAYLIECKTATGRLSPEQSAFLSDCRSMGFQTAVVRSLDDMVNALKAWGLTP